MKPRFASIARGGFKRPDMDVWAGDGEKYRGLAMDGEQKTQ